MFIVYQYNCFYPAHCISMTTFLQGKKTLLLSKSLYWQRSRSTYCMPGETRGWSWPITLLLSNCHQTHISLSVYSYIRNTAGFMEPVSGLFKHSLLNEDLLVLLFSFLRVQMPALCLVHQPLGVCRAPLLLYCTCALGKTGSAIANTWGK